MPDDLESILDSGAEAHARFVQESKDIDAAWKAGTLSDWTRSQIEGAKEEVARGD